LGICYGLQLMSHNLGGQVVPGGDRREFGKAMVDVLEPDALFAGLPNQFQAWMSHGDRVVQLPSGFKVLAQSGNIIAAAADESRRIWGVQFHPEVIHTHNGTKILENFLSRACGCKREWTMSAFVESAVKEISARIGSAAAICGLSGGVDSSVAALLVHKAIGDRLKCVFVDNGLLRKNEFESVIANFRDRFHLKVIGVDARERFLFRLRDVDEPEQKRKIIGDEFIRVFEAQAEELGNPPFLVQGTLYPDVIESTSVR
jgi:GMP synthase (glutamine-hydrolysing)